ncbi:MAG TPA: hypothetical protein VKS79_12740 [Gemmataceae bacterium]|nr:hypothetical protein [Gemmataceae bacterium]
MSTFALRRVLAVVICALVAAVLAVRAEPPAVPSSNTTPQNKSDELKNQVIREQEKLGREYKQFEGMLLRLAQTLDKSPAPEDRDKAQSLRKAIDIANQQQVENRFGKLLTTLVASKTLTYEDLEKAAGQNEELIKILRSMLDLLLTDNELLRKKEEIIKLEQMIKQVTELIRREKIEQANIDRGRLDTKDLLKEQNKVTKDTESLARQMGAAKPNDNKSGQKAPEGEARKSNDKNQGEAKDDYKGQKAETKDQKKDDAKQGDAKQGDAKQGDPKQGDSKQGDPKKSDPKQGDAKPGDAKKGDPKQGEAKQGDAKQGDAKHGDAKQGDSKQGDAKKGDPKQGDAKQGDAKQGDAKQGDAKQGDAKQGDAKQGDAKPNDQKNPDAKKQENQPAESKAKPEKKGDAKGDPQNAKKNDPKQDQQANNGQSKPSQGQPSQGQSKPNQGQQSNSQNQNQNQNQNNQNQNQQAQQPQQPQTPGRKQIEEALKGMEEVEKLLQELKKKEPSEKLDPVIAKLEELKKELEKRLRQLREEEMERKLANLRARCEQMLAIQIEVYEGTKRVHGVILTYPDKKPTRAEEQRSQQLSTREGEIVKLASKTMQLLEDEGSASAFALSLQSVQEDMGNIEKRLDKYDVAQMTQKIEEDVIQALKDMIEALKQAQQQLQDQKNQPKPPNPSQPPPQKLLNLLNELKLIRAMQIQVNKRTEDYGSQYKGEQTDDGRLQEEIQGLSKRQTKIEEMLKNIATGKNQ